MRLPATNTVTFFLNYTIQNNLSVMLKQLRQRWMILPTGLRIRLMSHLHDKTKRCPRFIWAKLKGTPVRWPVKVVGQTEDGLSVYVKSDHAVLSVEWQQTIPFPGPLERFKTECLAILERKKLKKTTEYFLSDLEWALLEDKGASDDDNTSIDVDYTVQGVDHTALDNDHTAIDDDHTVQDVDHTVIDDEHTVQDVDHIAIDDENTALVDDHTSIDDDHKVQDVDHTAIDDDNTALVDDHTAIDDEHTVQDVDHIAIDDDNTTLVDDHTVQDVDHTALDDDNTALVDDHTAIVDDHTVQDVDHTAIDDDITALVDDHTAKVNDKTAIDVVHTVQDDDHTSLDNDQTVQDVDHTALEDDHTALDDEHTVVDDDQTVQDVDHTAINDDITALVVYHTAIVNDKTAIDDVHAVQDVYCTAIDDDHTVQDDDHTSLDNDQTVLDVDHTALDDDHTALDDEHTVVDDDQTGLYDNHTAIGDDKTALDDDQTGLDDDHIDADQTALDDDHTALNDNHTDLEEDDTDDDSTSSESSDDNFSWGSFTLKPQSQKSLTETNKVRDINLPGIYIRKHITSNKASPAQANVKKKTNTRVYDNYHACYYCKELRQHINIHMKKHKDIAEVKNILQQTKADFSKLRKLGDHKHNKEVLRRGEGEIILSRRPEVFSVNDYGPCPDCTEWVLLKNLKRHLEMCSKKKVNLTKRQVIIISLVEAGAIASKPSTLMLKEVFPSMLSDNVGEVAKGDEAIVALGESWLRRCIDNREKRKNYTSQHMRLMAKVLIELRKMDGDPTKTFYDYLNPREFDKIVAAVLECCFPYMDDLEELKSPSNGIKLKYDLRRMITARWAMLVKTNPNSEAANEVKICLELLNIEWGDRIIKLARAVMTRRQMSIKRELPAPQDIHQLTVYLTSELKSLSLSVHQFSRVIQLAQTRLLVYNKRRSGEIDAIRLRSYAGRTRNIDELDQSLVGELTRVEQHLLKTQDLMKVRGKGNRPVPVLIPEDLQAALAFLANISIRREVGILNNNDYLFPVHGKSSEPSYSRSYDMLKRTCDECTLIAPNRITSVSMRKYTATLTQMLNLDKYQMDWVCRHLGHSDNVHKTHYRQMSDMIERVHVTKLLLLQDMNLTKKYKGQKLEDIDITEIVFPETQEDDGEGDPLVDIINERFPENERNEVPADDEIFEEMSESDVENLEDFSDSDVDEPPKKTKLVKHARQRWDSVETGEINKYFKRFLDACIVPRTKDVQKAQKKSKESSGKIWMRSVDKIVKKISAMNHKK